MLFRLTVVGLWVLSHVTASDKKISLDSRIRWVAPTKKEWKEADLGEEVKAYWEIEWSKSDWNESCSEDRLKIIPVYFWPGERVDLPCVMCELAFVFNGKMKRWAVAEEISEFMENPQKNVLSEGHWKDIKNPDWFDEGKSRPLVGDDKSDKLPYSFVKAGHPTSTLDEKESPIFFQRDGKLSIIRASPAIQGVYFCYDESSLGSTNLFYVVTAMVPPVSLSKDHAFTDGCSDTDFIRPSFNWRFHFLPAMRNNQTSVEVTNTTDGEICDLDHCRVDVLNIVDNSVKELNVAIELRWDEWTPCLGNVQRREAHCHLIRKQGQMIPEDASMAFAWLADLNSLLNLEPYKKEGIRLYSSLIPSLILGKDKLTGCKISDEARLDAAYREIFLYTMGVKTDKGEKISRNTNFDFRLKNAFQLCLGFEREKADWELTVGTYAIETQTCS